MPLMSRHLDEDDDAVRPSRRSAEREMTLGTGAILGIFFGLVVLLGAFFGFGYKLGSSSAKAPAAADAAEAPASTPSAAASASFNNFKPSAGSPASTSSSGAAPGVIVAAGSPPALTPPEGTSASHPTRQPAAGSPTTEPSTPLAHSSLAPAVAAPSTPMPATTPGGAFVVQVAAISHQEDADLLVNALHARGYTVAARTEPGDKLVHIQVGPFGNKKDAETMKARLTADGYNAFIK